MDIIWNWNDDTKQEYLPEYDTCGYDDNHDNDGNDGNDDNDFTDVDVENWRTMLYNMQNNSHDQLTTTQKIFRCSKNMEKEIEIDDEKITSIPIDIVSFDWLNKLVINGTKINILENLPLCLKVLVIIDNNIEILNGSVLPSSLKTLEFTNNKTSYVSGLREGLEEIDISDNNILHFNCEIPSSTITLNISDNKNLITLPNLQKNTCLKKLLMENTKISSIDDLLPDNLEILVSSKCSISKVTKLPKNLTSWQNYISHTESIECEFPPNLVELDLFGNYLQTIPNLPEGLNDLDLNNNILKTLPNIPKSLMKIDLRRNSGLDFSVITNLISKNPHMKILHDFDSDNTGSYMDMLSNYFTTQTTQTMQTMSHGNEYSSNNPNYIVLKKTYSL